MVPSTYVALDEAGTARMEKLIDMLEDLDDVSEIYHNWEEQNYDIQKKYRNLNKYIPCKIM